MVANLRVGFKKRQHKRHFESITVIPPPTKMPCTKILCSEPVSIIALVLEPLVAVAGTNHVLDMRPFSAGKAFHPKLCGPSIGLSYFSDDSVECIASILSCPQAPRAPNRKEIPELLKQVPCFTESEALVNNIGGLFLATRRVSVDLNGDPRNSFVA